MMDTLVEISRETNHFREPQRILERNQRESPVLEVVLFDPDTFGCEFNQGTTSKVDGHDSPK